MKWKLIGILAMVVIVAVAVTATIYGQEAPGSAPDADQDGIAGVQSPQSSSGQPAASVPVNVGSLLIDRTHGQDFAVSGFTDYLQTNGWTVDTAITGPITAATLGPYDILLIPTKITGSIGVFSAAEQTAVTSWVTGGGGIWGIHEAHEPPIHDGDPTGIDSITTNFGVTFNADLLTDPTNNEGNVMFPTIHNLDVHPVTQGINNFGYYMGASLNVSLPAETIAKGDDDTTSAVGAFPPVLAVAEMGSGCGVFYGDVSRLHPGNYPSQLDADEIRLLDNIVDWLIECGPEPVPNLTYSVKITCVPHLGPASPALMPAKYRTAVNVHNPWRDPVELTKSLTLSPPQGEPAIHGDPITEVLGPREAFDVDCPHMRDEFGIPANSKVPGGKGFMVIESDRELNVVAIYTARGEGSAASSGVGTSIDVEYIKPLRPPSPSP